MLRSLLAVTLGTALLTTTVWRVGASKDAVANDAPPALQATVDRTVARLGSAERAERAAAERELLDLGPQILSALPAADATGDPAIRTALERIRNKLEQTKAEESIRPSLVTYTGQGKAGDVLKDAGLPLTSKQAERSIVLAATKRPFWNFIDEVAVQIDGWPEATDAADQVTFRDRTPVDETKRIAYGEAFRFAAGPVTVKPIAKDSGRRLVRIPMEVRAEPRLRPLFLTYAARDLVLTTPTGQPLPPFTPEAKYEHPFAGAGEAVDLRLDYLDSTGNAAGPLTLNGTVQLTIAAGQERFSAVLEDRQPNGVKKAAAAPQRSGSVEVQVREATREADGTAEVEIAVVYDEGGPAFESYRTWVYHNDAELHFPIERDEERTLMRLEHEPGFSILAQTNGGVVLRYRFSGIPAEVQDVVFTYAAPTDILELPVEFEIDGLELDAASINAGNADAP